jgi:polyisoprenoid-binding protein YceI
MKKIMFSLVLSTVMYLPAHAEWMLNSDESTVSFVSTKAVNVAEVHKFTTLTGSVDSAGKVNVSIALASVDTGIELRDERMREMLFETDTYVAATLTAQVDMAIVGDMGAGESRPMAVEGELTLHGETMPLTLEVVVAQLAEGNLLVTSLKPVVVNAPLFKLEGGVEKLREIAGLPSISAAVPVSFVLSFEMQ